MKKIRYIIAIILIAICSTFALTACQTKASMWEKVTTIRLSPKWEKGWSTDNNGYTKDENDPMLKKMLETKPTDRQLYHSDSEYYNFVHFGMNTFTDSEWGSGKEDPTIFNPTELDTDQWARVFKASGSDGVILTAKHHDGFCLWPTDTTKHSIKYSPYKGGNGNIVQELADSCKKYDLKFGVYLSPWDMNAECYGKAGDANTPGSYNEFYMRQLKELLEMKHSDGTPIELFEMWFDGARGEDAVLEPGFEYDWDAIHETIYKYQPNCVAAVSGRDVRWVGNEGGIVRPSEWSVIVQGELTEKYQTKADQGKKMETSYDAKDKGSRKTIESFAKKSKEVKFAFKPAESDVKIRDGWFWHANQTPKSVDELVRLYYTNVGWNSSFLLNVGANTNGLIDESDATALIGMGDRIKADASKQIAVKGVRVGGSEASMKADENIRNILVDEKFNTNAALSYDNYRMPNDAHIMEFSFDAKKKIKRIDLREDLRYSQRVESIEIWAKKKNGKWKLIADNTIVGNRKIFMFKNPTETDTVRVVVRQSRSNPYFRFIGFYE